MIERKGTHARPILMFAVGRVLIEFLLSSCCFCISSRFQKGSASQGREVLAWCQMREDKIVVL